MTAQAPGQAAKPVERIACEAFWTAVGAGPDGTRPDAAWAWALSMGTGHGWRAVVSAVIAAQGPKPATAPAYRLACGCDDGDGRKYAAGGAWHCAVHGQTTVIGESGRHSTELAALHDQLASAKHALARLTSENPVRAQHEDFFEDEFRARIQYAQNALASLPFVSPPVPEAKS